MLAYGNGRSVTGRPPRDRPRAPSRALLRRARHDRAEARPCIARRGVGPYPDPSASALGVLGGLSGPLEAVLLALLHPRIAGEEAALPKCEAVLRVQLEQRPGDPVADRAGLAGDPAAFDLDHRVEAALGAGHAERHAHVGLVDRCPEMLDERPAVHHDLALTGQEANPGDRGLAATGAGVERRSSGHEADLLRRAAQA